MTLKKLIFGVLCLSPLIACESVSSSDVLTSGMYANLDVSADGSGLRPAQHVSSVGSRRGEGWVYDFAHEADILSVEHSGGDRVLTADSQEGGHTFEVLQRMLRRSVRGRLRNGYCVVSYAEALSVVKDTMLRPMLM